MKVALIGRNEARLGGVPYGDPSWSLWGLAWDPMWRDRLDVLFDPHWPVLAKSSAEYIAEIDRPVYLDETMVTDKFPTAQAYPLKEVISEIFHGRTPYLESSVGYMFALAILKGATTIGLYGISMNGTGEYAHQRPNMEYLIGFAHGRGINVIQDNTQRRPALLLSEWEAGRYGRINP
mgnify:CR=1 FL=1